MAKLTLEHQEEIFTFPVDSILELKIDEVSIETVNSQRGDDWTKARFQFKILGIQAIGDGSSPTPYESWIGRNIWGSIPWRLTDHVENKLRIWAEAIFRQELGEGFELDSDMFLQRNVRGLTSQYDGKGKDSRGNPFKRHQVETLLPWADGQVAQAPPAPATQQWQNPSAPPQQQQQWAPQPAGGVTDNGTGGGTAVDPWALPVSGSEPPF